MSGSEICGTECQLFTPDPSRLPPRLSRQTTQPLFSKSQFMQASRAAVSIHALVCFLSVLSQDGERFGRITFSATVLYVGDPWEGVMREEREEIDSIDVLRAFKKGDEEEANTEASIGERNCAVVQFGPGERVRVLCEHCTNDEACAFAKSYNHCAQVKASVVSMSQVVPAVSPSRLPRGWLAPNPVQRRVQ